jgi:Zn-dependent protease with chaperone function/uncharacterized tellurite resistance protein B-like protein
MNFYEHQDRAQRRTKIIVFLFFLAVVCIVAIVAIPTGIATEWELAPTIGTAVVCLLVVGIATIIKLGQLKGGGRVVAEMMGGTLLQQSGSTQSEKRVQNVVAEMAIASGMPVPPIYIVDDDSINAFAAGWTPSDAVIGVTKGCIEQLSRDELQGVVAHEFSHISHGDMKINIRLIGVVFGIMVLGIAGWILVRYIGPAVLRSSSRSRSKEGAGGAGVGLGIIVFGLFLALCGVIGTFFGRLIQAAVSRQREFLADASAVQYTRNPNGIGGALRKIGGITPLTSTPSDASQCNHMFFSQAMNAMFASHPPVEERVARVEGIDVASIGVQSKNETQKTGVGDSLASGFSSRSVQRAIENNEGTIQESLILSKKILSSIGSYILERVREPWSARLVLFALLVDENQPKQLKIVAKNLTAIEFVEYKKIAKEIAKTSDADRLPIIDLACPSLQQLSTKQKSDFNKMLTLLIQSDGAMDRFEWVFVTVVQKHIAPLKIERAKKTIAGSGVSVSLVLGMLAYYGATVKEAAQDAFISGAKTCGLENNTIPKLSDCSIEALRNALRRLQTMRYVDRKQFLLGCEKVVVHDGFVTATEAEVIRAIGDVLDCPIPPFN